jgi:peptide/nickel transport system substrate-binding protein
MKHKPALSSALPAALPPARQITRPRLPLLAACLVLGAAHAGAADLRIGFQAEITSADPHVHAVQNRNVWMHVYEPLVRQDAQLRATPGLARGWRALDAVTWNFTLRPNVFFHDGSPMTAEDVKFSIDRARAMPGARTLRAYLKDIEAVTVIDPMTVQVKTANPSPALPDNLSLVVVLPRSVGKADEDAFAQGKGAIGTGPYKFAEWVRGQRVVLARNDKYWGEREPWDKVSFEFIPKEPARATALLTGAVDIINGASASVIEALKRNPSIEQTATVSYMLNYLFLDQRPTTPLVTDMAGKPLPTNPLANLKVRQALALAIDRDVIARKVMKGDSEPAAQVVPEGFFGYEASLKPGRADVAKARALLAEAGYPQGFQMTLYCTNDRYLNDAKVCEALGQMLTQAGIKTAVQTQPYAVVLGKAQGTKPDVSDLSIGMMGIGAVSGDSLQPMIATLQSRDPKAGTGQNNYGRYGNAKLDALIAQANKTISPVEREALQRQAAQLAAEDLGIIPLHHIKASWAFRKGLGITPRADNFTYAMNVREGGAAAAAPASK